MIRTLGAPSSSSSSSSNPQSVGLTNTLSLRAFLLSARGVARGAGALQGSHSLGSWAGERAADTSDKAFTRHYTLSRPAINAYRTQVLRLLLSATRQPARP